MLRTCLPSSQEVLMVQMKNWDPLVSRPALAMAGGQLGLLRGPDSLQRTPGPVCLSLKFSSANCEVSSER